MILTDPPHPGLLVRSRCLVPHQITVADGARILGVTRQALNNLVNGKAGISPEMAIRLAKAFGGKDMFWLKLQLAYDLAQARKRTVTINVQRIHGQPQTDREKRFS